MYYIQNHYIHQKMLYIVEYMTYIHHMYGGKKNWIK